MTNPARVHGPHVIDWTGAAKNSVRQIRGGGLIKTLALDMGALQGYAEANPDSLRIYRLYDDPDARLDNWRQLNDRLIGNVQDYVASGAINAVELPYNERWQSVGDHIDAFAQVSADSADDLHERLPGVKVIGANFGVGNPPGTQENRFAGWELFAPALAHFDLLGLHQYAYPAFSDATWDYWWGRHASVYEWAAQNGIAMPPLVLTEFGLDRLLTGEGKTGGFRAAGLSPDAYRIALMWALSRLRRYSYLAGVAIFCFGVESATWKDYDGAGEQPLIDLLNSDVGVIDPTLNQPEVTPVAEPTQRKATEFGKWMAVPTNQWGEAPYPVMANEFRLHAARNAGVAPRTLTDEDLYKRGLPRPPKEEALTPQLAVKETNAKETFFLDLTNRGAAELPDRDKTIAESAAELSIPVKRMRAILSVESGGRPYALDTGDMIIRFELHVFLQRIDAAAKAKAAAHFRLVSGLQPWDNAAQEMRDESGEWVRIHTGDQAHEWLALTIAQGLGGNAAFQATSMGIAQIMGIHAERLGYATAKRMFLSLAVAEVNQINALEDFLVSDRRLLTAVRNGDAATFGRIYNGSPIYQAKLIAAGW